MTYIILIILIILSSFLLYNFKTGSSFEINIQKKEFCEKNSPKKYLNFLYYLNQITCPQIPFNEFKNAPDPFRFAKKNLSTTKNSTLFEKYKNRIKYIHKCFLEINSDYQSNTDDVNPDFNKSLKYDPINIKSILDIGTEYQEFLNILEEVFKTRAHGINIKEGFEHYEKKSNLIKDPRFSFYDGMNIPEGYDLITCFSVLHHIHPNHLDYFISKMAKSKVVIIKENDLYDQCASYFFDLQHDIYEGAVFKGKPSYRNSNFTLKTLKYLFAKHGKKRYSLYYNQGFSNNFYIIFY